METTLPIAEILESARGALTQAQSFAYYGDLKPADGWGWAFGVHRDSGALDRSNWQTISVDLANRFENDWTSENYSHCMVGWSEEGRVRVLIDPAKGIEAGNITDAFLAVLAWKEKLDSYPVADEEALSELEWEELCEYISAEAQYAWQRFAETHWQDGDIRRDADMPVWFTQDLLSCISEDHSSAEDLCGRDIERASLEVWQARIAEIRKRWQFFHARAGYVVGERAIGALELAKAEMRFEELDHCGLMQVRIEAEGGFSIDDLTDDPKMAAEIADKLDRDLWVCVCVMLDARKDSESPWECVGSLGMVVCEYGDPYLKVVTAELAMEHFHSTGEEL